MTSIFRLAVSAIIAVLVTSSANAQTGTYTWQVSNDNGATWANNCSSEAGTTIKVRLLASWTGIDPGGSRIGYLGGQFDVALIGASASDLIHTIVRPVPFNFAAQTLVAFPIIGGQKIDSSNDALEPGLGLGWVNPGQNVFFGLPDFSEAHPAIILTFSVLYSGLGAININSVLNPREGRAMGIVLFDMGSSVRLSTDSVSCIPATITPNPAVSVLLCFGGLLAARRHRTTHSTTRAKKSE